jgi:hypothetical protein
MVIPTDFSKSAYAEATYNLKRHLRDPDSAKISDVKVSGSSVCGLVNSKNGFGGYTGIQRFLINDKLDFLWVEDMGDVSETAAVLWSACQHIGDAIQ